MAKTLVLAQEPLWEQRLASWRRCGEQEAPNRQSLLTVIKKMYFGTGRKLRGMFQAKDEQIDALSRTACSTLNNSACTGELQGAANSRLPD